MYAALLWRIFPCKNDLDRVWLNLSCGYGEYCPYSRDMHLSELLQN